MPNPLNWALWTLSLFNAIAFLWLGLTVLLNAERRSVGTWVAGCGLLTAGLFFAGHATLVGRDLATLRGEMDAWWRVLWLLFVLPPYAWYMVMVWYNGVLGSARHRAWLLATSLLGMGLVALSLFTTLLPTYDAILDRSIAANPDPGSPVILPSIYPAYSVLCLALALIALLRPGPTRRFMGDLGRRRALPWLVATSWVLLAVSLLVGGVGGWLLTGVQTRQLDLLFPPTVELLMGWDLAILGLLALVAVLMGKAIVSYEIFTGKALPRGGLRRYWRRGLILAAGYGTMIGGSLALPINPTYRLLLATVLVVVFYALLAWRSYADREHSIENLRPFIASQRLYDHLLSPSGSVVGDAALPFRALCDELLGARVAYLVALGPLAALAGPPLSYPAGTRPPSASASFLGSPSLANALCTAVDPAEYGGAVWSVPLWSERGLIGVLLLGDKRDGGLYVQEEIEVARSVCERLIDSQASAEMARRLMGLQRQRLAESQLLDRSARRALHDDVLPRLHTALLMLNGGRSSESDGRGEVAEMLADAHRRISELLRSMPSPQAPEVARLGLMGALRHTVEGELRGAFDDVIWQIDPKAAVAAEGVPPLVADVTYSAAREAVRNAARHARDPESGRPLKLSISLVWEGGLRLVVEDDGMGLDEGDVPGSGGGQGLALHSTLMAVIGGVLVAEKLPGRGTRVSLSLPAAEPPWTPSARGPEKSEPPEWHDLSRPGRGRGWGEGGET